MPVTPGIEDPNVAAARRALNRWIGIRLREARDAKGFIRRDLAYDIGVSERTLVRMEVGRYDHDNYLVGLIAQACGVPMTSFYPMSLVAVLAEVGAEVGFPFPAELDQEAEAVPLADERFARTVCEWCGVRCTSDIVGEEKGAHYVFCSEAHRELWMEGGNANRKGRALRRPVPPATSSVDA
jgi:DNA-binding XRE family transcriptional regulator